MITGTLTGVKSVKGKLNRIRIATIEGSKVAINRSLKTIKNTANDYLENNRKLKGEYEYYRPTEKITSEHNWKLTEAYMYGNEVKGTIKNISDHAFYVEYGTSGPIRPVTSPLLYFIWRHQLIAKKQVAGQPPKFFFRNAIQAVSPYIKRYFIEEIKSRIY